MPVRVELVRHRLDVLLDDLILRGILKELKEVWIVDVHALKFEIKSVKTFRSAKIIDCGLHRLVIDLHMNVVEKLEDLIHLLLLGLVVLGLLLFIVDSDSTLELSNNLLVGNFS